MKIAVWIVWAVLTALWTLGAFATVELTQWVVQCLASDEARELGQAVGSWPVPPWLERWMDPASIARLQALVQWLVETARAGLPVLGSALGWLVPLVWVVWGFGVLMLVAVAGAVHYFISRVVQRPSRARY